jgi:hypothetical protein
MFPKHIFIKNYDVGLKLVKGPIHAHLCLNKVQDSQ